MNTTGANDMLESISPASLADRAITYSVVLVKSLYRLMVVRVKRTADVVDTEYNQQTWQKILASKNWLSATDLAEFLAPIDSTESLRKVDNKILRIDGQRYCRYRTAALSQLIMRHAGDARQIVELGCGYGYNLFSLHLHHPDLTFKGFDIAPNGIATGREIADHFGLSDKISLDRIDLTKADDPNLSAIAGQTAFTYFCIEQIPYDVRKVVENIIAAKPKRVINIEPTTELLDLTHPRDLVSLVYIRSVDYQTQLFSILDQLEREKRIRIIARERMPFAPTINNDGFLYCWEPI